MSLYVGHLSPHIRQEELERVFRRFGRCNVQLKDGYGFAVYEATGDAERALRALRGKPICGEQISLNWSNRQPGPFQRLARTARRNKPFHRRSLREENDEIGIRGSNDRRGIYPRTFSPLIYNHERRSLDDALDKNRGQTSEDIIDIEGDKGVNLGVMNEGGRIDVNQVANDRWGEPGADTLNVDGIDNGDEFDRYEPYHGFDKRDENQNTRMDSPYGSTDKGIPQEKRRRENSIDAADRKVNMSKTQQTCYQCGRVGHVMRTCFKADARREKFAKFNSKREEVNVRGKGRRLKRFRPNSWGSPDASRDPMIPRHRKRDGKESHSGNARKLAWKYERSPQSRERHRPKPREHSLYERSPQSRERHRPKPREHSLSKKESKHEHGAMRKTLKKGQYRKHCTPSSSSKSLRSSSPSHSQSPRSISDSSPPSCLRSTSSRSRSVSSNSRSSSYSKSVSSRSRSRSRLRSQSRSMSRSRSRSLTLSVSLERKVTPSLKNEQIDHSAKTFPEGNVKNATSPKFEHLESTKANNTCVMLEDENPSTTLKLDNETNIEHPGYNVDAQFSTIRIDYNEKNLCLNHSKYDAAAFENHEQKNGHREAFPFKLKRQTSTKHEARISTRLTTEEVFLALRHYGLGAPEGGQTSITVEEYFGAARLWPWEMIYYRRLKKGPISTENYARRLEQNREFDIVDKYIRSSSGWVEHSQEYT